MTQAYRLTKYQGQHFLVPRAYDQKTIRKLSRIASLVPGAQVEDDGSVAGGWDTLMTVRDLVEGPQEWEPAPVPEKFKPPTEYPPYQQTGIQFTAENLERGVINNDDVGLGKTVQTIAALDMMDPDAVRVVLCPAFIKSQWASEIRRWSKFKEVAVVYPPSDKRSRIAQAPNPNWVVGYYLNAEQILETYTAHRSYFLVVDEVHNLRGYKSKRLEAVATMATFSAGRVGLTASLLFNDAARMFQALNVISPGAWGNYTEYIKRYASGVEGEYGIIPGPVSNEAEFRKRLGTYRIRRTREEVAKQMPFDTKFQTIWLDPPPGNRLLLGRAVHMGRELAQHEHAVAMAKVPTIIEQIQTDLEAGLPSITFTHLREQAKSIAGLLPGSYLVLGGEDPSSRLDRIATYIKKCRLAKATPHMVGTFGAMGEGANLQWAKAVNIAALTYSPDEIKQAIGRAARMGQTGDVLIRLFVSKFTADEHLVKVLKDKLQDQFRVDGRVEKDKGKLDDALTLTSTKSALTRIYERMLREEQLEDQAKR